MSLMHSSLDPRRLTDLARDPVEHANKPTHVHARGLDGRLFRLVREADDTPVHEGETVTDFRGETHTIVGGRAPHGPSTGRVFTAAQQEFYPSVLGLTWKRV